MPLTFTTALNHGTARLSHLPTARRDAELLLLHATGRDRAFLLTHPDTELTSSQQSTYEQSLARRAQHEPVQYITGEQEFFGLALRVTPDVLIPRPETEHIVEALLERVPRKAPLRIADVGTGSGAIAIALATQLKRATITALDISASALAIARENAARHDVSNRIRFLESDLLAAVTGETFDAIVSNPPYVAESEILEPQVSNFEPPIALYAGRYGLDIHQRLIPQAEKALKPDGLLLMEIGHNQSEDLIELLHLGFASDFAYDLQGIPRVAIGLRL